MSDEPTSAPGDGEPPINWGSAGAAASATPPGGNRSGDPGIERLLGFPGSDLDGVVTLPDDIEDMAATIEADGRPFNGAYVPVVVHDPISAERSSDAAEWAADLIRTAGGDFLAVATFAEPEWDSRRLNPRQWNHAAAMIERLDGVCQRFRLQMAVRDTVGDQEARDDDGLDPARPIAHLIDTGRFAADGLVPVQLVCPERPAVDGGLVGRFRDLLRDRT